MPCDPQLFLVLAGGTRDPLYKLLKKFDSFYWADETQKALDELKALISKLLVLASPEPSETLLLVNTLCIAAELRV
jgi:hypothetical protein